MKRHNLSDRTFDVINKILVFLITLIIVYPLIFVISASISDPAAVNTGKMWLWPVDITFKGYKRVFQSDAIWLGYKNTIIYAIIGTIIHLMVLLPCSYALSRKGLMGKKMILWLILFTMFFNGGLIPTYLLVKKLGMIDTIWAIIIPNVVGPWSILVAKSFFEENIPNQLVEASKIDGASDFCVFRKIVLPISKPIIATMALFHAVGLWNQYFNALIYLSDEKLYPLQLILRQILVLNEVSVESMGSGGGTLESFVDQVKTASQVKYAIIIISALPLLIVYPFLQHFFVQGVLIGSIKE